MTLGSSPNPDEGNFKLTQSTEKVQSAIFYKYLRVELTIKLRLAILPLTPFLFYQPFEERFGKRWIPSMSRRNGETGQDSAVNTPIEIESSENTFAVAVFLKLEQFFLRDQVPSSAVSRSCWTSLCILTFARRCGHNIDTSIFARIECDPFFIPMPLQ